VNLEEALDVVVEHIWSNGEIYDGDGCLIPNAYLLNKQYSEEAQKFFDASDVLYNTYGATHFSRFWNEKGRSVVIELYKGNVFGAAVFGSEALVETIIVDINN
jgi:hypothetical protein